MTIYCPQAGPASRVLGLATWALFGCTSTPAPPAPPPTAVIVTVPGSDADISSLRLAVTLNDNMSMESPLELSPARSPFALTLPDDAQGQLVVTIDGITRYHEQLATGTGQVSVSPGTVQELNVPLTRQKVCLQQDPNGWCFESPLLRGDSISRIWAFGTNAVWAVGHRGLFLKWDGKLWKQAADTPEKDWGGLLDAMWGLAPDNIWLSSTRTTANNQVTYHWDGSNWNTIDGIGAHRLWAGGPSDVWGIIRNSSQVAHFDTPQSFKLMSTNQANSLWGVSGTSASDVWFVGASGAAVRWDGTQFIPLGATGITAYGVWVDKATQRAWAVGQTGMSAVSTDLGKSWTTLKQIDMAPDLFDVAGSAANDLWAVGARGTVLHGDGTNWNILPTNVLTTLMSISIAGANDVWFAGEGATVLHWNGATIETAHGGVPAFLDIWGTDVNNLWAVGAGGAIYRYDGNSWLPQKSGTTSDLQSIWGSSATDIWAVGMTTGPGIVLHWDGTAWTRATTAPVLGSLAVWGVDANNIWLAERNGRLYRWSGIAWNPQDTKIGVDITQINGSDINNVWVIRAGSNMTSQWDGSTWTLRPAPAKLLSVKPFSPSAVWATAEPSSAYRWDGNNWELQPLSINNLQSIWGASPSELWAVGFDHAIQVYSGSAWGSLYNGAMSFNVFGTSRLHRVWGLSAKDIWAVGDGGTILHRHVP